MAKQDVVPSKLLWMDLEMTGLDPDRDVILEVAVEITDFNFKTLESYESRVRGGSEQTVLSRMQANAWWQEFPQNRDEFIDKFSESRPLGVVEDELVELVSRHFGSEPAVLAGNSIHNDRGFIRRWWPALDLKLHYRMLDVSSIKILMQGKYGVIYAKQDVHRAFDDIQASIAELQYYLDWLRTNDKSTDN